MVSPWQSESALLSSSNSSSSQLLRFVSSNPDPFKLFYQAHAHLDPRTSRTVCVRSGSGTSRSRRIKYAPTSLHLIRSIGSPDALLPSSSFASPRLTQLAVHQHCTLHSLCVHFSVSRVPRVAAHTIAGTGTSSRTSTHQVYIASLYGGMIAATHAQNRRNRSAIFWSSRGGCICINSGRKTSMTISPTLNCAYILRGYWLLNRV